jgi:hypothetical protein
MTKLYIRLQNYKHSVLEDELAKVRLKMRELKKLENTILKVIEERRKKHE